MKLALLITSAVVATVAAFAAPQAGTAPPQTFRSTTNAVIVEAAVRDQTRKAIAGLTAADFRLFDNGVPQTVSDVSYGTRPIDVTIGLDISGSVTGSVISELRVAVVRLVGDLKPEDRLRLMLFNSTIRQALDFTADAKSVELVMRKAVPAGRTALYDALGVSLVSAADPGRRQLVVFFTDGEDSGSKTTPAMLQAVAQRTKATMTFVVSTAAEMSFSPVESFSMTMSHRVNPFLIQLAETTAGTVLPVETAADATIAFKRILSEFRQSYVLFFSPAGVDHGGFHNLVLEVNRPGAVVQARRGYFGG